MKPKVCAKCDVKVDEINGFKVNGYLVRLCKNCRRKFHNQKNLEKRNKLKQYKDWYG